MFALASAAASAITADLTVVESGSTCVEGAIESGCLLELSGVATGFCLSADAVFGDGAFGPPSGRKIPLVFPGEPIDISSVPEPGTASLLGIGLSVFAMNRSVDDGTVR